MKNLQLPILLLLSIFFVGHILIWLMMPTNTFYLHWLPSIHSKTDSTYFEQQGANILIYTFPILFIATLSSLYIHIKTKSIESYKESFFAASRDRPALIRGPLGIVSWTEILFLAMFVALLVWSFFCYLHGMFDNIKQQAVQMNELVWEMKLERSALTLGLVGNICLAFMFFPVTRGSSILQLIGLTSESSIKYHIWLGHMAVTLFAAHGFSYIVFWSKTNQISVQMLQWDRVGVSNVAGEVALLCGLIMWATAISRVRRKMFELFFYAHHLYIGFIIFFLFHVGFAYSCIMIPGFYLFLLDRYIRFLQSQSRVRLLSARVLPCHAVELNFSKCSGLSYNPQSIVFLNAPEISKLQWHPFTVTSNNNLDPEKLSIVVKSEGSWSQALYEMLSSSARVEQIAISLEGPYGPTTTNILRHEMLVMVSGGSGITPFISVVRELLTIADKGINKTPSVLLVCAFKKTVDLAWLDMILPDSGTNRDISCLRLKVEAYVTTEKQTSIENHKVIKNVYFEPDPLAVPVSAVFGPNSWLWLAIIISTSFVIFLLLTGVITRYYIYPIDHNSRSIYSVSYKTAMNMLLLCVSIVLTSTIAFLWNKRAKSKQTMEIQSASSNTPERELESLPHRSLDQVTTVHHGKRPNLKKILSQCKNSTGVYVSGPRKMRQEVAEICSSSGNNLHFKASSFSW